MARPLGLSLPVELGQNGYFKTNTDVRQQAKDNLRNLLLTRLGERPMQPEFGSRIYETLFSQITDDTEEFLRTDINFRIKKWLPYINPTEILVTPFPDENKIEIRITYFITPNSSFTDSITLVI